MRKLKRKIRNLYYDTRYGVANLVTWFPIVWNDRDWDHSFLFILLQFKLTRMKKVFDESNSMSYNHKKKTIRELKTCIALLERLIEENYTDTVEHQRLSKIDSRRAYTRKNYLHQYDVNLLFQIMSRKVTGWWD